MVVSDECEGGFVTWVSDRVIVTIRELGNKDAAT